MGEVLNARRSSSASRLDLLRGRLGRAEEIIADKMCVYITGSFGRGEAGTHSDLDLFIVGEGDVHDPALRNLDAICLKADLITATRELTFPEFSGDGEYLSHYPKQVLIKSLGRPDDDATNTFTARLLLLLESRPLLGESIYSTVIGDVIAEYWKDYPTHKNDFVPAFLANDILRLWRTFCVNYEARTAREPPEKRAKRKLKNYKLKHSRLLTCYSALLYLLAIFGAERTVRPEDAVAMTRQSPTQRLEWILQRKELADAHESVRLLIDQYEKFLTSTDFPEKALIERIINSNESLFSSAEGFGDLMFEIIETIGRRSNFHRVLVV
jgi:hypothetical protein